MKLKRTKVDEYIEVFAYPSAQSGAILWFSGFAMPINVDPLEKIIEKIGTELNEPYPSPEDERRVNALARANRPPPSAYGTVKPSKVPTRWCP